MSLRPENFANLLTLKDEIREALIKVNSEDEQNDEINLELYLGGGIYAKVVDSIKHVDLRYYFVPEGQSHPQASKRGLALKLHEFDAFLNYAEKIKEKSSDFATAQPTICDKIHGNQLDTDCLYCFPFPSLATHDDCPLVINE